MKKEPALPTIKTEIETYEYDDNMGNMCGGIETRQREVKRYLPGLSKREYFAGLAMQGLLSSHRTQQAMSRLGKSVDEVAAYMAIVVADALIKELEKTK